MPDNGSLARIKLKIVTTLFLTFFIVSAIACSRVEAPAQTEKETKPARVPPPLWADPPTPFDAERVSYLKSPVEPCIPLDGSSRNPCAIRSWGHTYWVDYVHPDQTTHVDMDVHWEARPRPTPTTELERLRKWFENVAETEGYGISARVPHIIARGVFLPGSTRCVFHESPSVDIECYIDIGVREYIVGRGPENLTLRPLSDVQYAQENRELYETEDYQKRLSAYVSKRWEGGEVIVYLGPNNLNWAVEVWKMLGFDAVRPRMDGGADVKGRDLDGFTGDLRNAHATVAAEHDFDLVEDANLKYLREHLQGYEPYQEVRGHVSPPPKPFTE